MKTSPNALNMEDNLQLKFIFNHLIYEAYG
jgi:hypothetical protein